LTTYGCIPYNAPHNLLDQGGAEGFRGVSGARHRQGARCPDHRGRWRDAKPLAGLGTGVWELAIKERGDAYRVVYALQLGDDIWVVHAFQKKSTKGISTPRHEIDLVRERIKRLKEMLDG